MPTWAITLLGGGGAAIVASVAAWWFRREAAGARKDRDAAMAAKKAAFDARDAAVKRAEAAEASVVTWRAEYAQALKRGADALAVAQATRWETSKDAVALAAAGKEEPRVVEAAHDVLADALRGGSVSQRAATEPGLAPGAGRDGADPPVRPATAAGPARGSR